MDSTFKRRLNEREEELRELYMGLYNDEAAFGAFLDTLRRGYEGRKKELRELDRKRERDRGWYKSRELLGMLMYAQCFGKTLRGVEEKLPYLKEAGVNYLHLMPLLESPKDRSDGGYAVADYRAVQPELGTMDDLESLCDSCRRDGLAVCIDFVMNHTSEDHEWAKRARAGEKEYQDRYFFYDDWTQPDLYERTVPQVFPTTAPGNFTWCHEAGKVVMTTFYPYQWDLNYANPAVLNDMTDDMLFLTNRGVDVIRLDATPYIWKELGTSCRNLPQVHSLVRIMRLTAEIVCPSVLLLGEVVMEPSKVVPYFGPVDKPECHMLYNVTTMASTWHTVATHDVRLLRSQLDKVFALPKVYTFLNYLRCHDDIGWGLDYGFLAQFGSEETPHKRYLNDFFTGKIPESDARGELYNDDPRLGDARLCGTTASLCGMECKGSEGAMTRAVRLDEMLHAFLLSQSGIPVLYSGDEVAQLNDYSYHDDPVKAADSRYLHRGDFDWERAESHTDASTPQGRIFGAIKRLTGLRREYAVFGSSAECWTMEPYNDSILAIGRYLDGEKLIALYNFSPERQTAHLNEHEDYIELITGAKRKVREVELSGYGFAWFLAEFHKAKG